jgi:SAM-dependent methyltransferase
VLFEDRSRAESFGAVAAQYDRARPSYPAALLDTLLADGGHTVLDVGCGTGIAAALFAARGCEVLGVEVDPRMAVVAAGKGIPVEVSDFEHWDDRGRRFDLLIAGQAWHWIDPRMGAQRAAEVLVPGGRIGLFWNFGRPPAELLTRLEPIYARRAPALDEHSVLLGQSDERAAGTVSSMAATGQFDVVEVHRFPWQQRYGTSEWLEHLSTHSDHQALAPEALHGLLAEVGEAVESLGGGVTMAYQAVLVTARRLGDRPGER